MLLLPAILSSSWVRGRAEAGISKAAGRHVSLGVLSVGWSESGAEDLVVRYGPGASDPVLLRVGSVRAPAGITTAFASRYEIVKVSILRPEVRLDRAAMKWAPPPPGAAPASAPSAGGEAGEGSVPPFHVAVEIREGTLVEVGLDGRERTLGTFNADLDASSDGPATAVFQLDLGAAGRFRLEAAGSPFVGGRPAGPDAMEGTVALLLDSLDLAVLLPAVRELGGGGLDRLDGTLSLKASARIAGGAVLDGKVEGALAGLAVAGPALGAGRTFAEPSADFAAGFLRTSEGQVEVKDLSLRAPALEVRGGVSLAPAGGPVDGTLFVEAELKGLLDRAKALGVAIPGDAVGDLRLEARAAGDGDAQRWSGSLHVSGMQISPGDGRLPVDEPSVNVEFDALRKGSTLRIDVGRVQSGSLLLEAKGTVSKEEASDLAVTGKAQLARLAAIARGFGAPLPGDVAGVAYIEARLLRAAPGTAGARDEARGTVTITGLVVTPPGKGAKPLSEDRFEIAFDAVPGEKSVDLRSLKVKGAGLDLAAAGRFDLDGGSGALTTLSSSLDLARASILAEAFGAAPPATAAGTASWTGPVAWRETFAAVDAGPGELLLRDLVLTLPAKEGSPARNLTEPEIRIAMETSLARSDAGISVDLRKCSLSGDGISMAASGTVAADGTLDLATTGSLALAPTTRRLLSLGLLEKDPAPRGSLAFDIAVAGKPDAAAATFRRFELVDADADLAVTGTASADGPVDLAVAAGGGLGPLLDLAAGAGFGERVEGATGTAVLRLRATAPDGKGPVAFDGEVSVASLSWPAQGGKRPWTQEKIAVAAKGTLDRAAETVRSTLLVTADGGTATLEGSADLAAGKRAVDGSATLDFDASGLTRAHPGLLPLSPMEVGRVKGTVKVKGPLPEPFSLAGLAGTALLSLDSVSTEAFVLENGSVDAILQGGVLRARSIAGTVNGGTVKGQALLVLAGEGPDHFVEVHAEGVQVDRAMGWLLKQVVPIFAVAESGAVSGKLRLDLRLDGKGADWEAVKPDLHGKGSLEIAEGGVSGSGMVVDLLELLGGAKSLEFRTITTEFSVHDGRVWNDRLAVGGKEHDMVLKGSTTFDGKLDYAVGAKFLKMKEKRRERLKPLMDGNGDLPFKLAGSLSRPKVRPPDLEKVLGNLAEDVLKKKLKELLGGDD